MGSKVTIPERVGRPAMKALAASKRLRGTRLDPFGRTEVRRTERRILDRFERALDRVVAGVDAGNLDEAIALAELPRAVRGYERLKLERAATFERELDAALATF
jgi:indolepyruvate ferredoxin oxidoreductase